MALHGVYEFKSEFFTLSGFADLYSTLDGLTKRQKSHALSPLLEEALSPMALVAASLAPDDPKTGAPYDLKSSITVSTHQRSGGSFRSRALGEYAARSYMGPTKYGYPEAIMMEFGTIYDTAQPYMRPAWESEKAGALKIITDGFAAQVFSAAQHYHIS